LIKQKCIPLFTGNLHKWVFCPRASAFIWSNPRRRRDWFRPLVTSAFEYLGLKSAFAYEGKLLSRMLVERL